MSGKLLFIAPFIMMILILGVLRTLSLSKPLIIAVVAISVAAVALHFVSLFVTTSTDNIDSSIIFEIGSLGCYSVFLGMSILGLLSSVLSVNEVTHDTLLGSLSAYLLVGILFAMLFRMVYILNPSEFAASVAPGMIPEFLYYSFTTLTTLGPGDISPLGPASRSLTTLEAIMGPVFLTVLVSRLVAHYVSQLENEK